jgi:hypothetical protein
VNIKTDDDDKLDEIVRNALCQPMPQSVEHQLRHRMENVRRHIAEEKSSTFPRPHFGWRYALPLGAAAALVVAVLSWLVAPRSSFAFAEVQAAIRKISTVAGTVHYPNAPQNDERGYLSADHKTMRAELPGGLVIVMSPNGQRLLLNTREKVAQLGPGTFPADDDTVRHILLELANVEQTAVRPLGVKETHGRSLVGFIVPSSQRPGIDLRSSIAKRMQTRVWVDPATHLPVMMEQVPLDPSDPVARVIELSTTYALNTPLDNSLFSMTPPAGYRLLKEGDKFPLPPPVLPKGYGPDSLIVNPRQGIGKARFGMSLEQVIEAAGSPDWIEEGREPTPEQEKLMTALKQRRPADSAERLEIGKQLETLYDAGKLTSWSLSYRSLGFELQVNRKNGLEGIMCFGYADPAPGVPAPYMGYFAILNYGASFGAGVMRPFVGRTSEGITVSSAPDEIIAAYGKPTDTMAHKNAKWFVYADHAERERLMIFGFVDGKINLMHFVTQKKER